MNRVALMGRLTTDPQLRNTPSGNSVLNFSLAVRRAFMREGGPDADFINCVAWKGTAEFIAKYFTKGKQIAIDGRLETSSWENERKEKRYKTEVIVEHAYFTGEKPQSSDGFTELGAYNEDDLPY